LGRLVAPGDPLDLAAGIAAELGTRRPRPARTSVSAHFDAERSIDRYASLVESTAAAAAGRRRLDRLLHNEADMAFRRRVPRLIEFLDLSGGERLLDCGSGMGVLSMIVGALHDDVSIVAVDRDRSRLEWAGREAVPAGLVEADIAALPFGDATFDAVLLAEVLEHLDDDEAGLREIARTLRPGGVVAMSVPHADYPLAWDPIGRLREAAGRPPRTAPGGITGQWSGHQRLYRRDSLVEVIERAGLCAEVVDEMTPHAFPLNHLLVYTVGKPLIEHDLLPTRLRTSADRFRGEDAASRRSVLNAAVGVLRRYDRRNDHPRGDERRFVQLVARAVKPS
jgi:SAM-dependent methyltransferase